MTADKALDDYDARVSDVDPCMQMSNETVWSAYKCNLRIWITITLSLSSLLLTLFSSSFFILIRLNSANSLSKKSLSENRRP